MGNPTEGALLLWLDSRGVDYQKCRMSVRILQELPFTAVNKYMATVAGLGDGKKYLFVKGAPEIVFALCHKTPGVTRAELDSLLAKYQSQAMRTLGFAYQQLEGDEEVISNGVVTAGALTFLGVVAISDPVRPEVPASMAEVLGAGIKVKIVTGDTPGTATEIGRHHIA